VNEGHAITEPASSLTLSVIGPHHLLTQNVGVDTTTAGRPAAVAAAIDMLWSPARAQADNVASFSARELRCRCTACTHPI
jgi:hypothetical protein